MAAGLLSATLSIASMFGAKGVESAKKGLADAQYARAEASAKWNQKELEKAFEENYRKTSYVYGQKIAEIGMQNAEAQSELVTSVASNISNADMAGSSFYNTAKLEAGEEFDDAIRNTMFNQSEALLGLARERDISSLQNATALSDAMFQSQNAKLQAGYDRQMTYAQGVIGALQGIGSEVSSGGALGDGLSSILSAKENVAKTAAKASSWVAALQNNQGSNGYLKSNFKY